MSAIATEQKACRDRRRLSTPFYVSVCRDEKDDATVVDYALNQIKSGILPLRVIFHEMRVENHAPFILTEKTIREFLSSGVVDTRRNVYTELEITSDYCEAGTWLYCCYPLLRRLEEVTDREGYADVWKRANTIARSTSQLTETQARVLLREGVLMGIPYQIPFSEKSIMALTDMLGRCGKAKQCIRFTYTRIYLRVVVSLVRRYNVPLDIVRIIISMVWGCRLTSDMLLRLYDTTPRNTIA